MFFYLEGLAYLFLFERGMATYLFSIWERMAFVFLFGGVGHLFIIWEGMATYLFSSLGMAIYFFGKDCFSLEQLFWKAFETKKERKLACVLLIYGSPEISDD